MRRLAIVLPLVLSAFSLADELTVGDRVPAFRVEAMVKGKAPNLSKGVHVLEFWSTWSSPVAKNAVLLTELARRHRGRVSFTRINVRESDEDPLSQVRGYAREMGDKLNYGVAFDGKDRAMEQGFMRAAGENGIPIAFLVKDGRALWIGHPAVGLAQTLDEVLAGTFDVGGAHVARQKAVAERDERWRVMSERLKPLRPAMELLGQKRYEESVAAFDAIKTDDRSVRSQIDSSRIAALAKIGGPRLGEESRAILKDARAENPHLRFRAIAALGGPSVADEARAALASPEGAVPTFLDSLAWWILDPEAKLPLPNYEAALILAEAAAKKSEMKNPGILDHYALALSKAGRVEEAIRVQTKAIALLKIDRATPARLKPYQDRLAALKMAKDGFKRDIARSLA